MAVDYFDEEDEFPLGSRERERTAETAAPSPAPVFTSAPPPPQAPPQTSAPSGPDPSQVSQLAAHAGISQDEARYWLDTNHGDFNRGMTTATWGNTDHRPAGIDSQSDYYDQTTNKLSAKGVAEVQRRGLTPVAEDWPDWAGSMPAGNGSTNGTTGFLPGVPRFANTSPMFTDPSQRLIEDTALGRLQELQNPDPNSGQGLYESFARQLVETLRGNPYSPQEEAALRTQAFDMLEQDRTATKQRWMEEVSHRGMAPSSGVALGGLQEIDRHYDQIRGQVTNQLAVNAINLTRQNRVQALDVLGGLAGTQNARLDKALGVSRIPYDLGTDAYQQMLQAVGAGGSPAANVQTAIQLATAVQNAQGLSSQQKAQFLRDLYTVAYGGGD